MMQFSVKVEKSGRVLVPAAVRRRLHLKEGESHVLLTVDDTEVRISSRWQALEKVRAALRQHVPKGADLAAELLAERRSEAAREDEK
jgi:AbrB family looped-hinge helix DNA binding protein